MKTAKGIINTWKRSDNSSGVTGVFYRPKHLKWYAEIQFEGVLHRLGGFDEFADAVIARLEKEVELYGDKAPNFNLYRLYQIALEEEDE